MATLDLGELVSFNEEKATAQSTFNSHLGLRVKGGGFIGKNLRVEGSLYSNGIISGNINSLNMLNQNNSVYIANNEVSQSQSVIVGIDATKTGSNAAANIAIGYQVLKEDTLGSYNTAVGYQSGIKITEGNGNVLLGANTDTYAATDSNSIAIGRNVIGKGSNTAVIGNSSVKNIYLSSNEGADVWMGKGHNAVWNDLADCIQVPEDTDLEPGYCYCFDGEKYYKSSKYLDGGFMGVHSDTAGIYMGSKKEGKELNAAVAGFVLAYVDKEYKPGTPLTCTKDGKMTYIKMIDRILHPHKIIATFWKKETAEEWGSDSEKVKVNNRMWVKIK